MNELYPLGTFPPLGSVPAKMYASVIRPDRFGPPRTAFRTEVVDVPRPGRGQVLVCVMAAGVNYNNVWASLGKPIDVIGMRQRRGDAEDFHIGGSDGSGIVWEVGDGVRQLAVGDAVILSSCRWDESSPDVRLGMEPMTSSSQSVWGYEENFGSFAQFTLVDEIQCHPKPPRMSWEEAGGFLVSAATAYRQLTGWPPNTVRPGDPVLIWGAAGGLGSMAVQIVRMLGGLPIGVVSGPERAAYCMELGAAGTIDRTEFDHWGRLPDADDTAAMREWTRSARRFGQRYREVAGTNRAPSIVFEHAGRDTLPTSMFICDNAGMVVICGATSGYNGDIDLRYLWMRQKRLQGSHYASLRQCRDVIELVGSGRLRACTTLSGSIDDLGEVHQAIYENRQSFGNDTVLINAPEPGLTSVDFLSDAGRTVRT